MKRFMNKKVAAIGLAAGLTLGLAGAAFAYWTSTGTGDGSGTTGTTTNWTVTVGNVSTDALSPGGPTETIDYSVQNNDTGNELLHQVVFTVENSDLSAFSLPASPNSNPQCTKSDFSLNGATAGSSYTASGINTELTPSGPGQTYSSSITIQLVDRSDSVAGNNTGNQDNCESVTVPIHAVAS